MALIDVKLFSTTLMTNTDIRVVVPTPDEPFAPDDTPFYKDGKGYQVLYLLHGAFGDCTVWTRNTGIERYAQVHKLMIVCASVTNSCYEDMVHGGKFLTYMTKELPAFIHAVFPASKRREDNFIAGISMGGYGAFRIGLADPERFSCIVSLSGAVDMATMVQSMASGSAPIAGPAAALSLTDTFADLQLSGTEHDHLWKVGQLKNAGIPLPKFYLCCGTEDFLYQLNQYTKARLEAVGVDLTYDEGTGMHNWDYWDPQIRKVLEWLPLKGTLVDL